MLRLCLSIALLVAAQALPQKETSHDTVIRSITSGYGRTGAARVIGGEAAARGQFPFSALIKSGDFVCGGALVSPRYVLTIAQCIEGLSYWEVYLGATDMSALEPGRVVVTTVEGLLYPGYNLELSWLTSDIGLIDLTVDVPFSTYIQPVKLPARSQIGKVFLGQTGLFVAWGSTSVSQKSLSSYSLNYASLTVIDDGNEGWAMHARGENGESGCDDFGSPLVQLDESQSARVIGLNSFVAGADGCNNAVSGFTIVSLYLDWISHVTGVQIDQVPA